MEDDELVGKLWNGKVLKNSLKIQGFWNKFQSTF